MALMIPIFVLNVELFNAKAGGIYIDTVLKSVITQKPLFYMFHLMSMVYFSTFTRNVMLILYSNNLSPQ